MQLSRQAKYFVLKNTNFNWRNYTYRTIAMLKDVCRSQVKKEKKGHKSDIKIYIN